MDVWITHLHVESDEEERRIATFIFFITRLKTQGPLRSCIESNNEEEEESMTPAPVPNARIGKSSRIASNQIALELYKTIP